MGHRTSASGAGFSTPEKAEALNRTTGQGPIDQHTRADSLHPAIDRKTFATLQARAALWGGSLTTVDGDDGRPVFIVTRWALTRAFDSLSQVDSWLQRAGAPG